MALGKDGNTKNSTSYKPYDASNSFVKRIANRVTDLLPWRSSIHECKHQNPEDSLHGSLNDDETVSPIPKRIKICRETDEFKFSPKTAVPGIDCSSIQPINDISVAGSSFRNTCVASSTPAPFVNYCVDNVSENAGKVMDYLDSSGPNYVSSTLPSMSSHHRHNVTIPVAYQKDMPCSSKFDLNRSSIESSSATNQRRPSFNAEILAASNKRLSLSVCENRSKSCLSPFYSARTMYGGASALLPYNISSGSRLRMESTSKLNIFSPRNQITIQPIPSPQRGTNDQETMSAAARRILDTLEKYCSPVKDAKRIPLNESSVKSENNCKSITPRGVKRKLPALSQMVPSTTDLLRIKRQEKMQDSVLNARQVVSSVPEISTAIIDSDSSSDSVDLDYTVFTENSSKNDDVGQFVGKIKKKYENKIDNTPPIPLKLPNAVLKITNLPKFNITDTFTFSKPLLLENLDNAEEGDNKTTTKSASKLCGSRAEFVESTNNSTKLSPVSRDVIATTDVRERAKSSASLPAVSETRASFIKNDTDRPNFKLNFANNIRKSIKVEEIRRWTCQQCLLENSGEKCSSCSSSRWTDSSRTEADDIKISNSESASKDSFLFKREDGSENAFFECGTAHLSADANATNENRNATNVGNGNVATCSSSTYDGDDDGVEKRGVTYDQNSSAPSGNDNVVGRGAVISDSVDNAAKFSAGNVSANPTELWKNLQKKADDTWKCDGCWINNKKSDSKCVACGASSKLPSAKAEEITDILKPAFTFGINNNESNVASSATKAIKFGGDGKLASGFTFGLSSVGGITNQNNSADSNATTTSGGNASAQFSFGIVNTANINCVATPANVNDENALRSAPTPAFTFGHVGKTDTRSTPSSPFAAATETSRVDTADKTCLNKPSEGTTFNDVSSSTSNKRNSFFKSIDNTSECILNPFKPSGQLNNALGKENGQDSAASTPNDITSSTEIPNKKKIVTFSSLFNKDAVNSTSLFGANGLPDSEFKLPSTNNVTAVSSSNSVFAANFSSSTSISAIANSKINHGQFSTPISEGRSYNESTSGGKNDTNLSSNRTVGAVVTLAATFDGSGSTRSVTAPTSADNNSIGIFSGLVNVNNNGGGSSGGIINHFNVSSSQSSNPIFGNFSSNDRSASKVSETPTLVTHFPATSATTTSNFNASVTPFRFGVGAPSNTPTTGGFAFNGPTMDSAVPKFGFGTSNNAFATSGSPFSFNAPTLATTSTENSLPGGSVFSSPKIPLCEGGQFSMIKSPPAFGSSAIGFAGAVSDAAKKSGGFSFNGPNQLTQPAINNFSAFGAPVNDNQDRNNFNNSNTMATTPFVFGSSSNQIGQSHNFSMTVPPSFNFTGGSSVPSFTAQSAAATVSAQPARKIKKAVRRTNK